MKAKIDKKGDIWVERAGSFKDALCPYTGEGPAFAPCGDWCPLFCEEDELGGIVKAVYLKCGRVPTSFELVEDARKRKKQ